ncbi:gas vesicle protein GvpL/GvpF [Nocardioides sp. J9]|uniref:GvpL/GvpF family gas vesicle protein n=1 Tax=Nocardioides sp. J9 TaxID=935844 RepID=UPI0011AA5C89|nr:GvpL/GvpF family gas vesicle protein [Nocardioides sp. J9]TWG90178.1 gas vesicle protein GvpL/GvpF [Nocardioides sp. J9]
MTDAAPATARYLYAVCRGLDASVLTGVAAMCGGRLELVEHRDLLAVVSTVPMAEFGEEPLRRHLEDIGWLEDTVRIHDDVVRTVASRVPTAPMRLATICFDDDAVRARLREWYVDLLHVLDRIEGCAEWSVKVVSLPAEEAVEEREPVLTGADYLRRKKAQAEQRSTREESAAEVARDVHEALVLLSRASRMLPAQDPRLSGHRGTMVLNAAYLVPEEEQAAFAALVERLGAGDARVVVDGRGPWPPYSFAMLEAS